MKPYLLFAYEHYEPQGGVDDYVRDFETIAAACDAGSDLCADYGYNSPDHWDVVDRATMRIVASDRQDRIE